MPDREPYARAVRNRKRTPALILVAVLACAAIATVAFRGVGRWLVCEDRLAKADVIVVLSGSMPARAEEAARIFSLGYAPEVWVSRPGNVGAELKSLGVSYAGEESYNRDVLIHLGVPADAIRIFPSPIVDTEQEVEEVSEQMRQTGKHSAIIVTSPPHTRRVKALWRRLTAQDLRMIVHAAWQDSYDGAHWWRNTHDVSAVGREVTGLLNVWAGLPVRPQAARVLP